MNQLTVMLWLGLGTVSFIMVIVLIAFFGRLMSLQFKIWLLAKKGYHQVEHIGLNKVRTYYYLRPKDNKFDFKSGFYLHIPETVTKVSEVIPKIPKDLVMKKLDDPGADTAQFKALSDKINSLNYNMDAVSLRWGIPTITYVGNDPNPVLFGEHEKVYGAQVIRDIYIRLLATQQYKKLEKLIVIGVIALAFIGVALVLLYLGYNGNGKHLATALSMLNESQRNYAVCLNTTAKILAQNSTMVI